MKLLFKTILPLLTITVIGLFPTYIQAADVPPNAGTCQCAFGSFEAPFPGGPTGDVCAYTADTSSAPLLSYAKFWAQTIIALTVAAGIVMVVIGGYIYMTAGGSADRIGKSKSFIGTALLGIALALTAYVILNTINPKLASKVDEPKLTSPLASSTPPAGAAKGATCWTTSWEDSSGKEVKPLLCRDKGYYCQIPAK